MKKVCVKNSTAAVDKKKVRLPPNMRACCKLCRFGQLHRWEDGNLHDPLIAICSAKDERNVAERFSCGLFEFFPQWENKIVRTHYKVHCSPDNKI